MLRRTRPNAAAQVRRLHVQKRRLPGASASRQAGWSPVLWGRTKRLHKNQGVTQSKPASQGHLSVCWVESTQCWLVGNTSIPFSAKSDHKALAITAVHKVRRLIIPHNRLAGCSLRATSSTSALAQNTESRATKASKLPHSLARFRFAHIW